MRTCTGDRHIHHNTLLYNAIPYTNLSASCHMCVYVYRCEFSGLDTDDIASLVCMAAAVLLVLAPIGYAVEALMAFVLAPVVRDPVPPCDGTCKGGGGDPVINSPQRVKIHPPNHTSIISWERRCGQWQTRAATCMRAARLRKQQVLLDYPSAIEEVGLMLKGIHLPKDGHMPAAEEETKGMCHVYMHCAYCVACGASFYRIHIFLLLPTSYLTRSTQTHTPLEPSRPNKNRLPTTRHA